jgi:cobalt/nickel transport system permease protein
VRGLAGNRARFKAAAGALAVLFARSYGRAEEIHRAMLSRGFPGYFRPLSAPRFGRADSLFLSSLIISLIIIRILIERAA